MTRRLCDGWWIVKKKQSSTLALPQQHSCVWTRWTRDRSCRCNRPWDMPRTGAIVVLHSRLLSNRNYNYRSIVHTCLHVSTGRYKYRKHYLTHRSSSLITHQPAPEDTCHILNKRRKNCSNRVRFDSQSTSTGLCFWKFLVDGWMWMMSRG